MLIYAKLTSYSFDGCFEGGEDPDERTRGEAAEDSKQEDLGSIA
jgi:hypothetical protein